MRTKNTLLNAAAAWGGQGLLIIVNLLSRKIFLDTLGAEYLGVNSLFGNILSFLSMAELGVGTAITYSLYKPLAEHDTEKLKSIMRLYRTAYFLIGSFILTAGLLLTPALPYFISGGEGLRRLDLIYILFVLNTGVSYFFSYKATLMIADQKKYIFNLNHYAWQFLMYGAQIAALRITGNYFFYLGCQLAATCLENVTTAHIVNRRYPFIKEKVVPRLPKESITEIKQNTMSMVLNKVGTTLVISTDNILISRFVGIAAVGVYTNYTTISAAVGNILYQGMYSVVASLGNLAVTADKKRKKEIFDTVYFTAVWIYGWFAITLYCLLTPFVRLYYGARFTMDKRAVFMICLNLYIAGQTVVKNIHIDAMGLYRHVRYKGIVEAVINLCASLFLVHRFGLFGVLFGTFLGYVSWSIWIETNTVLRHGLHTPAVPYYVRLFQDTLLVFFAGLLTRLAVESVGGAGIFSFFIRMLLCTFIPNCVFLICFCRRAELKELHRLLKGILKQ